MANLDEIQKKLNEDSDYQEAFMDDPSSVLEKDGLILSDEMKHELEHSMKELKTSKKAPSGASVKPSGSISIVISKRF